VPKIKNIQLGLTITLLLFGFAISAQRKLELLPLSKKVQLPNCKEGFPFHAISQFPINKITYKIIHASNKPWCNDLLADGKMKIHQPPDPELPGIEGFEIKTPVPILAEVIIGKI
jgi:hypothetical protein